MNKGYIFIAIFVIIALLGIFAKIFFPSIWHWFSVIDTASAVALAILAFWGYIEFARSEEPVKIIFDIDGKRYDTGLTLLRKDFKRGEVMGILGMMRKNQKKDFDVSFFKNINIFKKLQDIQTGKNKEFIIKMSKKEAEQFNINDNL
jgi:energy-coupling factor transporter transmembrane protein EcfT